MSDPVFFVEQVPTVANASFRLDGAEGRHAAVVRRIGPGERIVVSDGRGQGVRCCVVSADKSGLDLTVEEGDLQPRDPRTGPRIVAVQALAKGDRSELAIEMLTEIGVDEIVPWQSSRSIVRWQGDRGVKSLAKWRATVREATKQSRRLLIPQVSELVTTKQLAARVASTDLALVLHEDAGEHLSAVALPNAGEVLLIVGPEGGISPEELRAFEASGALPVLISDGVLRTSTAGVVAVGQLEALRAR